MKTSSLYLRKRPESGIYQIGYYQGSKLLWKSAGVRNKSEALNVLKNFEATQLTPTHPKTIVSFTAELLPYVSQTFSTGTYDVYRTALNYLIDIIGDIPLTEITQRHADTYRVERLQSLKRYSENEKVKPITVNCELRTIRAALNTAVRWKLLKENPFKGVTLAKIPETAPVFFSKEQFQTLLDAIREEWLKHFVLLATLTGMRRGELLNLRWENIDMQRKIIMLQSSETFRVKCGRRRTIPLSESAVYLLTERMGTKKSGYIFEHQGRQVDQDVVTHRVKEYIRQCFGEASPLRLHSTRHTTASWLVANGSTLYEVQTLLGHSSSAMTMRYAHLLPENLHSTVDKIQIRLN